MKKKEKAQANQVCVSVNARLPASSRGQGYWTMLVPAVVAALWPRIGFSWVLTALFP